MNKETYNKDKFQEIVSKKPSGFIEKQRLNRLSKRARTRSLTLALNVLAVLDNKNMSQAELAKKMDVSPQQVSKILKGQSNFTFETVDKLESALEITLVEIKTIDFDRQAINNKIVRKKLSERTIKVKTQRPSFSKVIPVKSPFETEKQTWAVGELIRLGDAEKNLKPTGS